MVTSLNTGRYKLASFIESTPFQFTPYRPESPVDAELYVGAQKQQAFQEGIQRVQGYVDNLYGLPLDNPADREYLQAKISQMKGAVDKSVSGDFSDSLLANQIGGLARQIAADPAIKAGVASTSNYRAGLAAIEQSKKDGKYALANEDDFRTEANKWLNDGKAGAVFNYSYTPHTDYNGKILKVLKDAGYDENTSEMPYVTDSMGNPLRDENGHQVLDTVKIQRYIKDNSSQVGALIRATLTPDDYKQMAIDGKYQYKGYTPQQLKEGWDGTFKDQDAAYTSKRLDLLKELSFEKDPDKIKQINAQLDDIQNKYSNLSNQYSKGIKLLSENPEQFKQQLFTNSYLANIDKALTTTISKTQEMESPRWRAWFDEQKFKDQQFRDNRDYDLKLKDYELKQGELQWKMAGSPTAGEGNGISFPGRMDVPKGDLVQDYKDGTATLIQQRDDGNMQLAMSALGRLNLGGNTDYTKKAWLADQAAKITASTGKQTTINDVANSWAEKAQELYRTDPTSIPSESIPLIRKLDDLNKMIEGRKKRIENAEQFAQSTTGGQGKADYSGSSIFDVIAGVAKRYNPTSVNSKEYNSAVENYLESHTTVPEANIQPLGTTEKDRKRILPIVSSILSQNFKAGRNIKGNAADIAAALSEEGSTFNVTELPPAGPNHQWQFMLTAVDKKGNKYDIPIQTKEEAQALTGKTYGDITDNILERINSSDFGSTNFYHDYRDPDAYKTAYFTPDKFKGVDSTKYTVDADAIRVLGQETGGNPTQNQYVVKLYIKKAGEKEFKTYDFSPPGTEGTYLSSEGVRIFPSLLSTEMIDQLVNKK